MLRENLCGSISVVACFWVCAWFVRMSVIVGVCVERTGELAGGLGCWEEGRWGRGGGGG